MITPIYILEGKDVWINKEVAMASKKEPPNKLKLMFTVTGSILPNGNTYFPFFMQSQIHSLTGFCEQTSVFAFNGNSNPASLAKFVRDFSKQVKQEKPDVIHALYGSITALASALAKGKEPLIVSFCGDDILGSTNRGLSWFFRNKLMRVFSKLAAWRAKYIIVKSQNLLEALPLKLRQKAFLIPNGVDCQVFALLDKSMSRRQLGWNENKRFVLFNPSRGNNQSVKNLPLAKSVIEKVWEQFPDTDLVLIENKTQAEIALMMNAADALLVTSQHEGSPNIVKEAMAVNLPVVTVNCGDVKERLKGVANSHVADAYDAGQLAQLLLRVFAGGQRSNGREELLRQGLTLEKTAEKIHAVYQKALSS